MPNPRNRDGPLDALRRHGLNLDPKTRPDEEYAYALGILAYFWGFSPWFLARLRSRMLEAAGRRPTWGDNAMVFEQRLKDHASEGIVAPNNDTLDAFGWLDLRQGPVLLELPEIGDRYYVFQCVDAYTNNFAYLSQLRYGRQPPAIAFCAPGYEGPLPWRAERIPAPTPTACVVGRIELRGGSDLDTVRALQRQIRLVPADGFRAVPVRQETIGTAGDASSSDPLSFYDALGELMVTNPPARREASLVALLRSIGLDPLRGFDASGLAEPVLRGLERAIAVAPRSLDAQAPKAGRKVRGWNVYDVGEVFGSDLLFRAVSTYVAPFAGLFIHEPREAYFPQVYFDGENELLDTSRWTYTLRFEAGELPPVDGFWSITMYERSTRHLVPNALRRYSVPGDTPELRYGADGSLTIYIQRDPPGADRESNWLPAPNALMYLTLRMYRPRAEAWNGTWTPPPVRKERRLDATA